MSSIYGALEAGGTKMVCAIGDETGKIIDQVSYPTTVPEETMSKIIGYFKDKDVQALGVACFGPIDPGVGSGTWGYILDTPKKAWKGYNIAGRLREALGVRIGFDTDVNGSLLGEVTFGASKDLTDVVYITIGTGVGAGILSGGRIVHGRLHPEVGHMRLQLLPGDEFAGNCPFHGTCFEGLCSGPAIEKRWGRPAKELADDMKVWETEASYIAQALASLTMILSPQRFILGGGVMHQKQLFPMIREKTLEYMGGYMITEDFPAMDEYIAPASLGDDQGIMGAVKLAMDAMWGCEQ